MASPSVEPWKLVDLDAWVDPLLIEIASRTVARVSIEFLVTNGTKPHVVFNLNINATAQKPKPYYKGVRLSMEWHGQDELDTGTFEIEPLPYLSSSHSASGAFDFPLLKTHLTVKEWVDIFRGRHVLTPPGGPHDSDLTRFRFVVAPSRKMDGCRDFICQSFIRLYSVGVVQGHGSGIGVGSSYENFSLIRRHPELGTGDDYWFFDIIDKNYVEFMSSSGLRIRISPMPMHRGVFVPDRQRTVERRETFHAGGLEYPLNYVARGSLPASSSSRSVGPPGPGDGGNGRSGGAPPTRMPGPQGLPPAGGASAGAGHGVGRAGGTGRGPSGTQTSRQAVTAANPPARSGGLASRAGGASAQTSGQPLTATNPPARSGGLASRAGGASAQTSGQPLTATNPPARSGGLAPRAGDVSAQATARLHVAAPPKGAAPPKRGAPTRVVHNENPMGNIAYVRSTA